MNSLNLISQSNDPLAPSIPLVDDINSPDQVEIAITSTKRAASGGASGIPAGILKLLSPV